ncbi:hypothetical protein CFAM422_007821 [Trichoderma lentiforme]|uniref:Uncharacterized protein n=1 Tax=Trichoderma lentiforme TaxID=1567552 RepID=A0A9P4XCP9_9HYPO|nr:hypothetical protein CFAM422_007821 [Trichoderma lentiforme]
MVDPQQPVRVPQEPLDNTHRAAFSSIKFGKLPQSVKRMKADRQQAKETATTNAHKALMSNLQDILSPLRLIWPRSRLKDAISVVYQSRLSGGTGMTMILWRNG